MWDDPTKYFNTEYMKKGKTNVIDILTKIKASSQAEQRKIDMAKEHLKDIKSLTRRLEIKIESLERQLEELKKDV